MKGGPSVARGCESQYPGANVQVGCYTGHTPSVGNACLGFGASTEVGSSPG